MTEDDFARVSSSESMPSKGRKKRKWDQPAESFPSAGIIVPGVLPLANLGSLVGFAAPVFAPLAGLPFTNSTIVGSALLPQQHAVLGVQKQNQPKVQDEVIAREIVINDADSAVRYKLTKRQTQEEIQRSTGAVVITRGKYRPPDAPHDGEKPLYLHISAGAHLETTVDRIKAVDRASAMVEEILKQGLVSSGNKVFSTSVFLGFEADPSLNIAARIRGPNDQYVNHIMNETGATVLLRGRGSGTSENACDEDKHQPLHLFLSCDDPKSLEHAKLLAENLLDTICAECGTTRISSAKVYGAVPPPPQLLNDVHSTGNDLKVGDTEAVASLSPSSVGHITVAPPVSSFTACGVTGTSYIGYGGIYPQATPLQQVALALRQSISPITSTIAPTAMTATSTVTHTSAHANGSSVPEMEKRPAQRRKFQELPTSLKDPVHPCQAKSRVRVLDVSARDSTSMTSPNFNFSSSNVMPTTPPKMMPAPPPPPKMMPPSPPPLKMMPSPPPPPKFDSSASKTQDTKVLKKSIPASIPDTLVKLMDYGDDDDDDVDETTEEPLKSNSHTAGPPKPFWAV